MRIFVAYQLPSGVGAKWRLLLHSNSFSVKEGTQKFPGKFSNQDLGSRNPQKQRLNIPTGFGVYIYESKWAQKWGERGGDVYFAAAQRVRERD